MNLQPVRFKLNKAEHQREGLALSSRIHAISRVMPLPPLPEQRTIARYLDHVDLRIQRYIHAKQKRITLLHEARQAIIHRYASPAASTPTSRSKPSGVDWLGDVPAHWEVRRIRDVAKCGSAIGLTIAPSRMRGTFRPDSVTMSMKWTTALPASFQRFCKPRNFRRWGTIFRLFNRLMGLSQKRGNIAVASAPEAVVRALIGMRCEPSISRVFVVTI